MRLEDLLRLRPFVYHLTAASNVASIVRAGQLEATGRLFERAGRADDARLRSRRPAALSLDIAGEPIAIRDQKPLHERCIAFEPGWDMARLVERLNALVFFWPGTERGPIRPGQGHFELYQGQGEELRVLQIPTAALLAANAPRAPLLSRCNSGAPSRFQKPGAPRGGGTFVPVERAGFTPAQAVELVFEGSARLPPETLAGPTPQGPWRSLARRAGSSRSERA
ncbi:MAG: hypothetical protein EOO75_15390 [Myxococcales bacterium]|nr:MAG: hypothetical protein EOO75_15390 [Myxococcales bacterium]